jgi:hypothetical protein
MRRLYQYIEVPSAKYHHIYEAPEVRLKCACFLLSSALLRIIPRPSVHQSVSAFGPSWNIGLFSSDPVHDILLTQPTALSRTRSARLASKQEAVVGWLHAFRVSRMLACFVMHRHPGLRGSWMMRPLSTCMYLRFYPSWTFLFTHLYEILYARVLRPLTWHLE